MAFDAKQLLVKFKKGPEPLTCGAEFLINVQHTMPIADCDNPTDDEQDRMMNALMREWLAKAQPQCDQIANCTNPTVVDVAESGNTCDGQTNQWTVQLQINTKCEP